MIDESIVRAVQNYLWKCREQGLEVRFGVIFGSQVKGTSHEWSDIDLVVVSPAFDAVRRDEIINLLWHTTAYTDNRIEPIACGEWQWAHDDVSTDHRSGASRGRAHRSGRRNTGVRGGKIRQVPETRRLLGGIMNWQERITVDPAILVGKPVIKGTRLAVEFVIDLLAQGWSESEILRNYPGLTREDIQACLRYVSALLHSEKVYPLPAA